jgi:hypothetical protein
MVKCPGQDQRFWKPDDIFDVKCPSCGALIEFWKDEPKLKCPKCKETVSNPKIDLGCAEWCPHGEECLGFYNGQDKDILCNRLINEMKKVLTDKPELIEYTLELLKYADSIGLIDSADPLVVKASAILNKVDLQETQSTPIAHQILKKCEIESNVAEHVCQIISDHHRARNIDTPESMILWDAAWLIKFGGQAPNTDKNKMNELINSTIKTEKGKEIAAELFIHKKRNDSDII